MAPQGPIGKSTPPSLTPLPGSGSHKPVKSSAEESIKKLAKLFKQFIKWVQSFSNKKPPDIRSATVITPRTKASKSNPTQRRLKKTPTTETPKTPIPNNSQQIASESNSTQRCFRETPTTETPQKKPEALVPNNSQQVAPKSNPTQRRFSETSTTEIPETPIPSNSQQVASKSNQTQEHLKKTPATETPQKKPEALVPNNSQQVAPKSNPTQRRLKKTPTTETPQKNPEALVPSNLWETPEQKVTRASLEERINELETLKAKRTVPWKKPGLVAKSELEVQEKWCEDHIDPWIKQHKEELAELDQAIEKQNSNKKPPGANGPL